MEPYLWVLTEMGDCMKTDSVKNDFEKVAMKVSFVSIVANVALSVFKLLAGILAYSGAMISDAIHSASDVISTVVVIEIGRAHV